MYDSLWVDDDTVLQTAKNLSIERISVVPRIFLGLAFIDRDLAAAEQFACAFLIHDRFCSYTQTRYHSTTANSGRMYAKLRARTSRRLGLNVGPLHSLSKCR